MENEYSNYHCSPEWHLAQLARTPFAALLYPFAHRISKDTGSFHGSVVGIAAYFDVSRWKVQRAIKALLDLGFFVLISQEPFMPSVYGVLSHKEWAAARPGGCVVKETFRWSGESGDPLGVQLWNVSGGRVKYQPYKLAALRKTGLTDDQIVGKFGQFIANENARRKAGRWHGRWGPVQHRFLRWLTGALSQTELESLGLAPAVVPMETTKTINPKAVFSDAVQHGCHTNV